MVLEKNIAASGLWNGRSRVRLSMNRLVPGQRMRAPVLNESASISFFRRHLVWICSVNELKEAISLIWEEIYFK